MNKIIFRIFLFVFGSSIAFAGDESPLGYWKTIDDVTGKVKSIIHITESSGHLSGQLVRIYPGKGESVNDLCVHCRGEKHNKPILGMTILSGMKEAKTQWEGGNILDPTTGKSYKLTMQTIDNGNKLRVHGYIGLPLFGRTQIWERTDDQAIDKRFKE